MVRRQIANLSHASSNLVFVSEADSAGRGRACKALAAGFDSLVSHCVVSSMAERPLVKRAMTVQLRHDALRP